MITAFRLNDPKHYLIVETDGEKRPIYLDQGDSLQVTDNDTGRQLWVLTESPLGPLKPGRERLVRAWNILRRGY